ncbi:MAG TPA: flippase [Armatimonadota bacterium]|jgi:O-antigen/teichoic acid export membrane protein
MTRSILVIGLARAVSLAFGVILLAVLARRLGPGGFGTLQLALAVMAYPLIFVDLGLTTLGLREIARGSPSSEVVDRVVPARLTLLVATLLVLAAGLVLVPVSMELRTVLVVLGIGLPAAALNARWVIQGKRRFGQTAFIDVVTTGSQLLAALILVNPGDEALAAAGALTIAAWTTTATSVLLAGRWPRPRSALGLHIPATILRGLPLGAASIAITIYYSFDTILLGIFRSGEEVAYYAAAYRVILPVLSLAGAVGTVAIPQLSFLVARRDAGTGIAVTRLCRQLVLWALPMAVGGALTAEPIILLVFGPEFLPAVAPFQILIWSVVTVYSNAAFAFLLLARGRDRRYLAAAAAGALVNMGLNLLIIPIAGMLGAALTTIVSELTVLSLLVWWTRDVSFAALPAAMRTAAIPTVVMALVVWPIRYSLLAVPAGIVAFLLVAAATGAIPVRSALARLR